MSDPTLGRPTLLTALRHFPRFLGYVLKRFRLARWALLLALVLLALEYAVFSLMIPLSDGAGAKSGGGAVVRFWSAVAQQLQLEPVAVTWLWLFLLLLALRTVLGYVHVLLTNWLAKQVHRHLSERTFARVLMDEPMPLIYRRSIGYYITLAGDDTFRAGTIINTASQALASLMSALAGFGLLYLFSAQAFWATVGFLAACAVLVGMGFRALMRINARSVALARETSTGYIEALNGLRSIRSMASEPFFLRSYADQIGRYVRMLFEIDAVKSSIKFMPAIIALLIGVVVLWPGSQRAGDITATYFFAVTLLLMRLFVSLGATVNHASVMLMDLRAATDIDELVNAPPHLESHAPAAPAAAVNTVELRGLEYGYRPGHKVLDGLDFAFLPGKTVAIVGPSGSGKSTLADILLGLISPDRGAVLVNGGHGSLAALRQHVILVEQQARIFSTSVRENLLLGRQCDDDTLWKALRLVDLEQHVRALPGGLSAPFEYQGANLSGGQRQRLGIARALIREPQVLILDEATSALDGRTRELVVANLREFMREGVLIFITHDDALAGSADVVLSLGQQASPAPSPAVPERAPA
ncbi:ATP-binding cassette domain-containing protein [Piscinibacter sp. XHJ-5]|uniref:ATP-binding cassette domain-containing protein n=1 Tax=Piscinibacter sp. XHJ-5 TaxID=3037797 RepID=UPI002452D0D8|nr:ATP-binding cassette domain-containing protein [Piscinibacter sp. XHJ-5]